MDWPQGGWERAEQLVARVGDTISGGLTWTRSIRLGGVQLRRNFGLRPDLVTIALPGVSGSAAVPTTVDVFVNNIRTYSTELGQGPYRISDIPTLSGSGQAKVVVRDVTGREIEEVLPFYTTPLLLKPGIFDFSLEVGYPRLRYGIESDLYSNRPMASASGRAGVMDALTVEGHAEAATGFVNAGLGANFGLGGYGVLSAALAGSHHERETGFQGYVAFEGRWGGWQVHASTQRTFGEYRDLASLTALLNRDVFASYTLAPQYDPSSYGFLLDSGLPPRALDRVTIGLPTGVLNGTLAASYVHQERQVGEHNHILSGTWSRTWSTGLNVFVTAFTDLSDRHSSGVFAGLNMRFGEIATSGGVQQTPDGTRLFAEATRPLSTEPGSYGWRVSTAEGQQPIRQAAASYRSSIGRAEVRTIQIDSSARGELEVEGAVGMLGGAPFLSDRIGDAFAVVDVGASGVPILYENRPAGTTGFDGRVVLPRLRPWERNRIGVDVLSLPLDADIAGTGAEVVPSQRGGVLVDFGIRSSGASAVVVLLDRNQQILPAGLGGATDRGETFVIGYDGEAYLTNLAGENTATVSLEDGTTCTASFTFARNGHQPRIGPVRCE